MKVGGIILTLALLVVSAYVLYQDHTTPPTINFALEPYVTEWKQSMDSAGIDYTFRFNQLHEIRVGILESHGTSSGTSNIITVNSSILKDPVLARQTVFHELGHYVFHFDHKEGESIMNIKDLGSSFYADNWNRLVNDYIQEAR